MRVFLLLILVLFSQTGFAGNCQDPFRPAAESEWILVANDFGLKYPDLVTQSLISGIQELVEKQMGTTVHLGYNTKSGAIRILTNLNTVNLGSEPPSRVDLNRLPSYLKAGKSIINGNGNRVAWDSTRADSQIKKLSELRDLIQFHIHTFSCGLVACGPNGGDISQLLRMNRDVFGAYFGEAEKINLSEGSTFNTYTAVILQLQLVEFLTRHTIDLLNELKESNAFGPLSSKKFVEAQQRLAQNDRQGQVRTFYGDEVITAQKKSPIKNAKDMYAGISGRYAFANNTYFEVLTTLLYKSELGAYVGAIPEPIMEFANLYTQTIYGLGLNAHPFFRFLIETLDFPAIALTARE